MKSVLRFILSLALAPPTTWNNFMDRVDEIVKNAPALNLYKKLIIACMLESIAEDDKTIAE